MDPSAKQGGTNGDPGVQLMNGEGRVSALVLRSACGWLPSLRSGSTGKVHFSQRINCDTSVMAVLGLFPGEAAGVGDERT